MVIGRVLFMVMVIYLHATTHAFGFDSLLSVWRSGLFQTTLALESGGQFSPVLRWKRLAVAIDLRNVYADGFSPRHMK